VGVFTKEKYISYLIISFIIFCTILLSYYLIVNYVYQTFNIAPELKVMLLSICVFYLCTQFLANVYKAVLFLINRIDE
jgi:cation transporter-like permease